MSKPLQTLVLKTAPSLALLRAILRRSTQGSQVRHATSWMPRERYATPTRLDKLHRKQKADNRIERQSSAKRAQEMQPPPFTSIHETSAPSSADSTIDLVPQAPTPSESSVTSTQNSPSPLPYLIQRTRMRNFPVYESHKAGGSKHITTIRRCTGDLDSLQTHLLTALDLKPSFIDPKGIKKQNVVINRLTNHIVVRGWRGAEIRKWCEMAGF